MMMAMFLIQIQIGSIGYIDSNKHNNNLDNLRKITISENVKSAYYI